MFLTCICLFAAIIVSIPTHGQAPSLLWGKTLGKVDADYGYYTDALTQTKMHAVDVNNDIYVFSGFDDEIDIDPGLSTQIIESEGSSDLCIQKFDTNGNLIWFKTLGGSNTEYFSSITTDENGNLYMAGLFGSTMDFDPGPGTSFLEPLPPYNGSLSGFVMKMDTDGNFLWANRVDCIFKSMVVDGLGNLILTGQFKRFVDFDPGPDQMVLQSVPYPSSSTNYSNDVFVLKLDENGEFLWVKQIGDDDLDRGAAITVDSENNIYVAGEFDAYWGMDFNPDSPSYILQSNGFSDIFLLKLDSDGNFVWARAEGGSLIDRVSRLEVDQFGDLILTGFYRGNADLEFGPGESIIASNGEVDFFIQKVDTAGNNIWTRSFGGSYLDYIRGLGTDEAGNIYASGFFSQSLDFAFGLDTMTVSAVSASYDAYLLKLDSLGNSVWIQPWSSQNDEQIWGIEVDSENNLVLLGINGGPLDLDPSPDVSIVTPTEPEEAFLMKLALCPNTTIQLEETMLFSDSLYFASYQWLDCNNGMAPLDSDTFTTYLAQNSGTYALETNVWGCVDTSSCTEVLVSDLGQAELTNVTPAAYPNPTTGHIRIELGSLSFETPIQVLTPLGQFLPLSELKSSEDFDYLLPETPGLYIIQFPYSDGTIESLKIVKY